ncbi:MAG TPA: YSC84-related protein [Steroidobacteraceae bacterium]|nr:YSC84-related protein [Steroidobacteraceae bacterium]
MILGLPRALLIAGLALVPPSGLAASFAEIDARVREALADLYKTSPAAKELAAKARGMLVFPRIIQGGAGVGAEYGEGALLVGGRTANYYKIGSASIGFQLGVQEKSVAILFMDDAELERFQSSDGWMAGVDGSIAIASLGAGESIDTETTRKPIVGFVFSNKGLMYDLTLEGSKITRLKK